MLKPFLTIISVLFTLTALAQKKSDTTIFFVKYPMQIVQKAADADYVVYVTPPDKEVDSTLFVVKGYYPSGKLMFITSSVQKGKIVYQGSYIGFYPNRKKMIVKHYNQGTLTGDVIAYYPNGKMYTKTSYTAENKLFLSDYADSTGVKLATDGNGQWVKYSDDFTSIISKGLVKEGKEDGEWQGKLNDSLTIVYVYNEGKIIKSTTVEKSGKVHGFEAIEVNPTFPGGLEALYQFIQKKKSYPSEARNNNTQGRVMVSFVIERDGSLTDIKVKKGIGDGCDEEAVRVLKLSPKWTPGYQYGIPIRAAYTIPISFP